MWVTSKHVLQIKKHPALFKNRDSPNVFSTIIAFLLNVSSLKFPDSDFALSGLISDCKFKGCRWAFKLELLSNAFLCFLLVFSSLYFTEKNSRVLSFSLWNGVISAECYLKATQNKTCFTCSKTCDWANRRNNCLFLMPALLWILAVQRACAIM